MRKLAMLIVTLLGLVTTAHAQIVPALPFQLQNNTLADATQVMANFNQILNNVNANAAKNGSNSDITALLGLTTPLAPGVGGTTTFTGGTSGGAANAQTVATVVPSTFTLIVGSRVVFVAGFSNTAALTLNVAASGAKAVFRKTNLGAVTTAGYEVRVGDIVEVVYDGTQFQLIGPTTVIGEIRDWAGTGSIPPDWLKADGTCYATATYPGLQSVIGSWGAGCGGGTFNVPDTQGRVTVMADGVGRITTTCPSAASITTSCGAQQQTIAQANLPNLSWPSTLGVSRSGSVALSAAAAGVLNNQGIGGGANVTGGGGTYNIGAVTVSDTQSWSSTGSVTSGGSGTALPTVQPTLIVTKIIKY